MADLDCADAEGRLSTLVKAVETRAKAAESWALNHAEAADCRDLEAMLLEDAIFLDRLTRLDADWHSDVFRGAASYDASFEEKIFRLYQAWEKSGEKTLERIEEWEDLGCQVVGAEGFRAVLEEVRGMLTPDAEFFDTEALTARQDAAIDAHRRGETIEFEEMGDYRG